MLASELSPAESEALIFNQLAAVFPVPFAKLVTAQTGHETNGWTSNVYMSLNNVAGYGFNGVTYKDYPAGVEDSVQDLIGYIQRKIASGAFPDPVNITTGQQWADLLKSVGYYTDSAFNYANGLSRWFNDNLDLVGNMAEILIFVAIGYLLLRS
jgi:hypothetical protein